MIEPLTGTLPLSDYITYFQPIIIPTPAGIGDQYTISDGLTLTQGILRAVREGGPTGATIVNFVMTNDLVINMFTLIFAMAAIWFVIGFIKRRLKLGNEYGDQLVRIAQRELKPTAMDRRIARMQNRAKVVLIIAGLGLLAALTPTARAAPNIPPDIEKKANTILEAAAKSLAPIEYQYYSVYKRHWQGIRTHATIPSNGAATAPDLTLHPTDQVENWLAVGVPLPATMEIAISVEIYHGPDGAGYVVIGEIEVTKTVWRRQMNYGPEKWRDSKWTIKPSKDDLP